MNARKNLVIAILAAAVLGCGYFAWNQYQDIVALRADRFTTAEKTALEKRLWDAEKRVRELEAQLAANRGRVTAPVAAADAAQNAGARGRANQANIANITTQMQGAIQALMMSPQLAAMQKSNLSIQYAALASKLNLTPEQSDQLATTLANQQSSMMDVMAAAQDQGVNVRGNPQAIQQLMESSRAETETSLRQLLGDDGYSSYQQYNQTLPQRNTVNQLQQQLIAANVPLTSEQSEQMISVLAANPAQGAANPLAALMGGGGGGGGAAAAMGMGGMTMGMGGGGGGAATLSDAALSNASTVLSPAQLKIVQQAQQASQAQQQMQNSMIQAMTGAMRGGAAGGGGGGGGARRGGN